VPWGSEGFVVGIFGGETDDIEVLFDEPFVGGITLGGRAPSSRGYRMPSSWVVSISHGLRVMGEPPLRQPTREEEGALRAAAAESRRQATSTDAAPATAAPASASVIAAPAPVGGKDNKAASAGLLAMIRSGGAGAESVGSKGAAAASSGASAGMALASVLGVKPLAAPQDADGQAPSSNAESHTKKKRQQRQATAAPVSVSGNAPAAKRPPRAEQGNGSLAPARAPAGPAKDAGPGFRGRAARAAKRQEEGATEAVFADSLAHQVWGGVGRGWYLKVSSAHSKSCPTSLFSPQASAVADGRAHILDEYAALWRELSTAAASAEGGK
jgi:hypothetical protein